MSPQAPTKSEKYLAAWVRGLASLLSRLTSANWQVETASDYAPLASVRIISEGGLCGQQCLSFSAVDVAELLRIFLGEEVSVSTELNGMQREALEELVRQWAGLVASALKPDFGEVTWQVAADPAGPVPAGLIQVLRVSDGTRGITVQMALDDPLACALAETAVGPPVAAPSPAPSIPAAPAANSGRVEELLRQGNLELLMEVELAVALRFGCRQTTLHEVLNLATGAVLELDREIQDPVDLVLNGRVIARGEVVVVDGNYGLRINEVASAQGRVSSL